MTRPKKIFIGVAVVAAILLILAAEFVLPDFKKRNQFHAVMPDAFGVHGLALTNVQHYWTGFFMDYPEYFKFTATQEQVDAIIKERHLTSITRSETENEPGLKNRLWPLWWIPEDYVDASYYRGGPYYLVHDPKSGTTFVHKQI